MANQNQDVFFNELYDATHEKILAYIIVKCGNTEDVADIFQETYTEIVKVIRKHGIEYFKKPEAFVMQVAKKKIYRHYKLLERLHGIEETYDFDESNLENIDIEQISFEEFLATKETVEMAISYLIQKDELTKKVFYLYYFMDKSIKEIADLFSVKESNVKNKLYRTLKELREYLLKEGMV
ncbi:MAG: sigma-70 family RNA polymerase sigma factor [Lachnospiraceae bacterium]|nr:sigma-70 family RNA polymerase sigma factor [Lachnospiraceae bacterium]